MRYFVFVALCASTGIAGCGNPGSESPEPASESTQGNYANQTDDPPAVQASANDGWTLYSPPEKDFSVMAPVKVEVNVRVAKVGKFREYVFRKGQAYFTVTIHTDRKHPLAGNSVDELKSDTSDYVPGSVRNISLGNMSGIEFRTQGGIGESIFREYCAPDNSRTISIQVAKDFGDGLGKEEVRLFLNSFKLFP